MLVAAIQLVEMPQPMTNTGKLQFIPGPLVEILVANGLQLFRAEIKSITISPRSIQCAQRQACWNHCRVEFVGHWRKGASVPLKIQVLHPLGLGDEQPQAVVRQGEVIKPGLSIRGSHCFDKIAVHIHGERREDTGGIGDTGETPVKEFNVCVGKEGDMPLRCNDLSHNTVIKNLTIAVQIAVNQSGDLAVSSSDLTHPVKGVISEGQGIALGINELRYYKPRWIDGGYSKILKYLAFRSIDTATDHSIAIFDDLESRSVRRSVVAYQRTRS